MPTYEYACTSCGEHLEVVQSFRDEALTECPACGGPLRKVFGSIGVVFKGSGFYKTDSRPGDSKKAASDSSTTTTTSSSADSSSSSKETTSSSKEPAKSSESSSSSGSSTASTPKAAAAS